MRDPSGNLPPGATKSMARDMGRAVPVSATTTGPHCPEVMVREQECGAALKLYRHGKGIFCKGLSLKGTAHLTEGYQVCPEHSMGWEAEPAATVCAELESGMPHQHSLPGSAPEPRLHSFRRLSQQGMTPLLSSIWRLRWQTGWSEPRTIPHLPSRLGAGPGYCRQAPQDT